MNKALRQLFAALIVFLLIFIQGCTRPRAVTSAVPTLPSNEAPNLPTQTVIPASPTLPPTPTPVPAMVEISSPTPTLALVTVTAVGGDLAIRSGPDMVFNAVAVLRNGETATASARSILDGWVRIPIPSQAAQTGWVSIQTKYSVVGGNVLDLPMIRKVEWPTGAYLINCTAHQMRAEPGGTLIPPVGDAPNNRVWFTPSLYKIYDMDVAGQPFVMNIFLDAHSQVSIQIDGNRQRSDCPK